MPGKALTHRRRGEGRRPGEKGLGRGGRLNRRAASSSPGVAGSWAAVGAPRLRGVPPAAPPGAPPARAGGRAPLRRGPRRGGGRTRTRGGTGRTGRGTARTRTAWCPRPAHTRTRRATRGATPKDAVAGCGAGVQTHACGGGRAHTETASGPGGRTAPPVTRPPHDRHSPEQRRDVRRDSGGQRAAQGTQRVPDLHKEVTVGGTVHRQHSRARTRELSAVPSTQEHNILAQPSAGSVYERTT